MIEVGATNVGSIVQSFVPGRAVVKGEEKGMFAFGGSCVITLFQEGRMIFDDDLVGPERLLHRDLCPDGRPHGGRPPVSVFLEPAYLVRSA